MKAEKYIEEPKIQPEGKCYRLIEEYSYKDTKVPKGFLTDGLTYKIRFFGLFVDKFSPLYAKAFIIHDYLTEDGDWDKAQKYLDELLPNNWKKKFILFFTESYRKAKGL